MPKKQRKARDLGRNMCRTGWSLVSGEWDEQQKIGWSVKAATSRKAKEKEEMRYTWDISKVSNVSCRVDLTVLLIYSSYIKRYLINIICDKIWLGMLCYV